MMKSIHIKTLIIIAAIAIMWPVALIEATTPEGAQEQPSQESSIVRIIEDTEAIAIYDIPADIIENLNKSLGALKRPGATGLRKAVKKDPLTTDGYRIQVFSDGSHPATLQARAKARGNMIVAKFPKYRGQIYSFSASPNWYTRVGNFQTSEEAQKALTELKRAFPGFAAEMRIVKSTVKIIK